MLSISVYRVIHLFGIFLVLGGLGGLCALVASGGQTSQPVRRMLMVVHGLGMLLVLLGGFGLLAKMYASGDWALWVWLKLVIWIVLGLIPVLARRSKEAATLLLVGIPLLAGLAAYLVIYHVGAGP